MTLAMSDISFRYSEPRAPAPAPFPGRALAATALFRLRESRIRKAYWQEVAMVNAGSGAWAALSDADLASARAQMRQRVRSGLARRDRAVLADALGLVRESAERTLGMRPYDVQMLCALAMTDNLLVQLAPGEGKTLTLGLVGVLRGWSGHPCHMITANDYLAARDAELMTPLYAACGLEVAAVTADMETDGKTAAYQADLVYSTAKQLLADYLQDQLSMGFAPNRLALSVDQLRQGRQSQSKPLMMRGLHHAVVDEADSLLIDEATTPLIISGPHDDPVLTAGVEAARIRVEELFPGSDYRLDELYQDVRFTRAGEWKLQSFAPELPPLWRHPERLRDLFQQAVLARDYFQQDRHYVVVDDEVVIVDEGTGRTMPGRTWSYGLHQSIEARAGVPLTSPNRTLTRMSFQNFFRLYHQLAGASGTLQNIAAELYYNYGTHTLRVPARLPSRRRVDLYQASADRAGKWQNLVQTMTDWHTRGSPVLVGTRNIADSEYLSQELTALGLEHQVLNAKNPDTEAAIVAAGGQPGRITVATNMAGRGTDIPVPEAVQRQGGLVVLMAEPHESARVDWQLFGRTGRQGQPGLVRPFAACNDLLLVRHLRRYWWPLLWLVRTGLAGSRTLSFLIRRAQERAQTRAFRQRQRLNRQDRKGREMMSFVRE